MKNILSCCGGKNKHTNVRRATVYYESKEGALIEDVSDQFFFDAVEEEIGNDELYPIITTAYPPSRPEKVSMEDPETLLREDPPQDTSARSVPTVPATAAPESLTNKSTKSLPARPDLKKRQSTLRRLFGRRDTMQATQALQAPPKVIEERGFPGKLTMEELALCQSFYRALKEKPILAEIVYNLREVEDEPYSLCRFLRGNKFDLERTLQRLNDFIPGWNQAKENDFYPNLSERWNVPLPVFLKYYPETKYGNAKNKCPVSYLQAGKMDSASLLSLLSIEQSEEYFWHMYMHTFPKMIQKAKEDGSESFVRCEGINVIDFQGVRRSQLTSEAMDCMKVAGKVGDYFPETLHSLLVLNAPGWFAMSWSIIKSFIDPRTAKKIEIYSSAEKGTKRLFELVDETEVPSDFGGTGPSIEKITQDSDYNSNVKWLMKEVTLKPKSKRIVDIEISPEEHLSSLKIYTRSSSSAMVSLCIDGDVQETKTIEKTSGHTTATFDITSVTSSSDVKLEFLDQNDSTDKKRPRGDYVIVGRIIAK